MRFLISPGSLAKGDADVCVGACVVAMVNCPNAGKNIGLSDSMLRAEPTVLLWSKEPWSESSPLLLLKDATALLEM